MAIPEQQQSFTEQLASEYRRGYKSGHASGARQAKTGEPASSEPIEPQQIALPQELLNVLAELRDLMQRGVAVFEVIARRIGV